MKAYKNKETEELVSGDWQRNPRRRGKLIWAGWGLDPARGAMGRVIWGGIPFAAKMDTVAGS